MSTDLHAALREAVADAPFDESDLRAVVDAGSRRLRRRAAFRVGVSALVVAAFVVSAVAVDSDRSDQEPLPADVVHLDLNRAERQDLDVLASVRTTWRSAYELDHDHFEGLTTDGRVLRSRYAYDGDVYELGLLNPETGSTDWLPPPPVAAQTAVELTADRLVLFAPVRPRRSALLVFDRQSETWDSSTVHLPAGLEVHVPFRLALGSDGRLYLGSTFEGESGPLNWWHGETEYRPVPTATARSLCRARVLNGSWPRSAQRDASCPPTPSWPGCPSLSGWPATSPSSPTGAVTRHRRSR